MRLFALWIIAAALASCSNEKKNTVLNTGNLTKQVFKISTANDTVVKTANGALLTIQKESFNSTGVVEIEVKEAYSFADIIKAGLTTRSNGKALSSDGMIYINAVDDAVEIAKPITVSLPAEEYDVEMKLYKGEGKDGDINWIDPKK